MSTVFITGANRGIGLELARVFTGRGDTVIAGCRRSSPELDATGARCEELDVADDASVAALAARLDDDIDLLVHNAGVLQRTRLDDLDLAAIRRQFEINALGPVKLTAALRHRLVDGGKVAIVTSRMGSIADNTSGSHYGHRGREPLPRPAAAEHRRGAAPPRLRAHRHDGGERQLERRRGRCGAGAADRRADAGEQRHVLARRGAGAAVVKVHLRDRKAELVEAWQRSFHGCDAVSASCGDIFDGTEADAIVSPANSFGYMDGGIDLVYSRRFGWDVQERLQRRIRDRWAGELPVGCAEVVRIDGDDAFSFLISAPTMRVPLDVATTVNAYLAFRAALLAVRQHNAHARDPIRTILCPGLATAIGRMSPHRCALQMGVAWQAVHGEVEGVHALGRLRELDGRMRSW